MKKFCAVVCIFAAVLVLTAVWYSPLAEFGSVGVYENNELIEITDGVCYAQDRAVRVELAGGESALYAALDKISAEVVFTAEAGGRMIVYAYSPRVTSDTLTASNGKEYNLMAACDGNNVVIGSPVLQGSY